MREKNPERDDEALPDLRSRAHELDDLDDDLPIQRPRLRRRNRGESREKESLKQLIRDIPSFLKLLVGLGRDPRVSKMDKAIVLATVAYIAMPLDLIPDFLPFIGQIDDLYLLALALDRLLNNAGIDILLDHWDGDVAGLEMAISALDRAGSFLPDSIRNLLHQRVR